MTDYEPTYRKSFAIVVGVNEYEHDSLNALGSAEQDAQAVASILASPQYGFEVTLILGQAATIQRVEHELRQLKKTEADDRVLFYFAGHGYTMRDELEDEIGYLACYDTDPDDLYGGLEFEEVTKIRRYVKAKHVAFILDTCFSGKALGLTRAALPTSVAQEYLTRRAWQVLTAGGDETVSDVKSMSRLLVRVLEDGIPGHTGPMTLSHVGSYIKDEMVQISHGNQIPICQYVHGSGNGEMVLRGLKTIPSTIGVLIVEDSVHHPVGQQFPVNDKEVRIGRALTNDVILKDRSVSKQHAVIRRDGIRYVLQDADSTYGTVINDVQPENGAGELKDGDLIQLGTSTKLRFKVRKPGAFDIEDATIDQTIDDISQHTAKTIKGKKPKL